MSKPVPYKTKDKNGNLHTNHSNEAEKIIDLIDQLSEALKANKNSQLEQDLKTVRGVANCFHTNYLTDLTPFNYEDYLDSIKKCRDELPKMLNDKGLTSNSELKKQLKQFNDYINDPNNLFKQFEKGVDDYINFAYDLRNGKLENDFYKINKTKHYFGVKPTNLEARNLSLYNENIDETVDHLIWTLTARHKAATLGVGNNGNFYEASIQNIVDELDTAPADKLCEFSKQLLIRRIALQDRLFDIYDKAYTTAPKDVDAEAYACKTVFNSDEYDAYCGFNRIGIPLAHSMYGALTQYHAELPIKDKGKEILFSTRYNKKGGEALLNKIPSKLVKKNILKSESGVLPETIQKYEKQLNNTGYKMSDNINGLIDLYEMLANDKADASESYEYMRQTLKAVATYDGDVFSSKYEHLLETAQKASEDYLASHSGHRFTSSGQRRQDWSKQISTQIKNVKTDLDAQKQLEQAKHAQAPQL